MKRYRISVESDFTFVERMHSAQGFDERRFPAPLSPSRATISPRYNFKSTPDRALTKPNDFLAPTTSKAMSEN